MSMVTLLVMVVHTVIFHIHHGIGCECIPGFKRGSRIVMVLVIIIVTIGGVVIFVTPTMSIMFPQIMGE